MLLLKIAKRRKKETHIVTAHKIFVKTHIVQQTKHQLRQKINRNVNFGTKRIWMGPLNDENTPQVDEKNKNN